MKKTIKVIDLLNMIVNGNIPKKVKYEGKVYKYEDSEEDYVTFIINHYEWLLDSINIISQLNDEVEILEEDEKPKEIKLIDIKCENERTGNCYIINENGTKCFLTKHSKIIVEQQNKIAKAVNYLLKKEDE